MKDILYQMVKDEFGSQSIQPIYLGEGVEFHAWKEKYLCKWYVVAHYPNSERRNLTLLREATEEQAQNTLAEINRRLLEMGVVLHDGELGQ